MTTENQEPKAGQSAAVERPKLPSLAKSKALRVLLRIAKQDHVDHKSLLLLLILINAHPRLTAHYRIFENLAALIETPPVLDYLEDHPEAQGQIINWKNLCQWVIGNKSRLAQMADLSEFDYTPPAAGSGTAPHPLNRNIHGFTRNGACSCLFNRHESAPDYDTLPTQGSAAYQYLCLQAQLLVSYVQCRMIPGMLRQMFCNTGKDEWPALPISSYSVSVAIRHLNHQRYAGLLANLNTDATFNDFNQHLHSVKIPADVAQGLVEEEADAVLQQVELYLSYLQKYFNAVDKHLRGQYKKKIRGSGKGSSHRRFSGTRTGFIHIGDGVWLEKTDDKEEDNDFSYSPIQSVYISDSRDEQDEIQAEASGLAPNEARTEAIKLFHPDEIGGAMMRAKYAEMAKMMSAQRFVWDFEVLTPTELQRLWRSIDKIITGAASLDGKWNYQTNTQVQCAIIIKVMLLLGQDLETVRNAHFSSARDTRKDGIFLRPPLGQSIGYWELPSVSPHYRTTLNKNTVKLGRSKGEWILLPDLAGINIDIQIYLAKTGRTMNRIFTVEHRTAKKGVEAILDDLKETWKLPSRKGKKYQVDSSEQSVQRITQTKIRNAIGARLRYISRDAAVEWIISASSKHKGETRMHYTNLSDEKIIATYSSAVRSLMLDMEVPLKPTRINLSETNSFHGARFVASMASVKRLVANVSDQLKIKPKHTDRRSVIRYHNVYTFYVWLLQSMLTSYRAVNSPDELMNERRFQFNARFSGLSDKENPRLADKARLVLVPELLMDQLNKFDHHLFKIERKFGISTYGFPHSRRADRHFYFLDPQGNPMPVTCSWCEKMMDEFKVLLPGNFHRAFLRTELIDRGCDGQTVDAFLGHANSGESPFFRYSSMDYQIWSDQLEPQLTALAGELGFLFQPSRIVKK